MGNLTSQTTKNIYDIKKKGFLFYYYLPCCHGAAPRLFERGNRSKENCEILMETMKKNK